MALLGSTVLCFFFVFCLPVIVVVAAALGQLFCVRVCISASTALSASSATSHEFYPQTYAYSIGKNCGSFVCLKKQVIFETKKLAHNFVRGKLKNISSFLIHSFIFLNYHCYHPYRSCINEWCVFVLPAFFPLSLLSFAFCAFFSCVILRFVCSSSFSYFPLLLLLLLPLEGCHSVPSRFALRHRFVL